MKINYLKKYGTDGTVYNQTITIDIETAKMFNDYIKMKKMQVEQAFKEKRTYSNEDMKILYYLEELKEGKNYTHLTTLDYFMNFYLKCIYEPPKKDKTYERILWRNTIINVKESE